MFTKFAVWLDSVLSPENIGRWLTSLGGRRFLLSLGAGATSSILVWYSKITPEIYRDVVLGTVGMFIAGTTFQKNVQIKTTGGPSSGGP